MYNRQNYSSLYLRHHWITNRVVETDEISEMKVILVQDYNRRNKSKGPKDADMFASSAKDLQDYRQEGRNRWLLRRSESKDENLRKYPFWTGFVYV